MHLFLSPHLDDAVLSCGGLIHQLIQHGETVMVWTIMAGDPPEPLPHSPLIDELHARWQAGEHPLMTRRREDQAALERLGAQFKHWPIPDCPYRTSPQGEALYETSEALFSHIHADDPALALELVIPPAVQTVYAPLGAGGHVDHLIVRQLALPLANFFYEEYPYSANSRESIRTRINQTDSLYGTKAVQVALSAFDSPLTPHLVSLSEADLTAKIAAIGCYESQISTFWADQAEMQHKVRTYGAERLWKTGESNS